MSGGGHHDDHGSKKSAYGGWFWLLLILLVVVLFGWGSLALSQGSSKSKDRDEKAGQGKNPAGARSQPESRSSFVGAAQVPAEEESLRLSLGGGGQREVRFILPLGDWSPEIKFPPGAVWNLDLEPHVGFMAKVTDDLGAGREVSVAAHKPLVALGLTRVKFQGVAPGQVMVVSISEAPPKAR